MLPAAVTWSSDNEAMCLARNGIGNAKKHILKVNHQGAALGQRVWTVAQPGGGEGGARPRPRNWVHTKIPGCATEFGTD